MNKEALEKRFHDLSFICYCRGGYLCSACTEQIQISKRLNNETNSDNRAQAEQDVSAED